MDFRSEPQKKRVKVSGTSKRSRNDSKSSNESLKNKKVPTPQQQKKTDIFGLSRRPLNDDTSDPTTVSFFVNKVANGNERRAAEVEGDYIVDLKVYRATDICGVDSIDAWRKALVRIKLQTMDDSEQWKCLQRFVRSADEIFTDDPKFYKERTS